VTASSLIADFRYINYYITKSSFVVETMTYQRCRPLLRAMGTRYFALLLGAMLSPQTLAEQVNLAVASNFMKPMAALQAAFEQSSGHTLLVSFGSSGRLYAQITNGAPFDVFLSADEAKTQALDLAKLTLEKPQIYATGRLVVWSRNSAVKVVGLQSLEEPAVLKIALANPRLAPYGIAAMQTLENAGIYAKVRSKLVMGESIAQTYQFTFTGSAQLGFVALSQVLESAAQADYWTVPEELHEPIHQSAAVLKRAKNKPAAWEFFEFLLSPTAAAIISKFGYTSVTDSEYDL
jgi:molybdate transport system substrate-binding protein